MQPVAPAAFSRFPSRQQIRHVRHHQEEDLVQSIADGIQFISYYHPVDYIRHLARAYEREESPAARDAMAQILTNSRMCAEGKRPLCQDTGIVNVFLKVGMDVRFDTKRSLQELCDEGVRRGYLNPDNPLRASVLDDPLFARKNTRDNTPVSCTSTWSPVTRSTCRSRQGRRFREQDQVRHAQPQRLAGGLGAQDRADHGRGLVPARHAGHRRRRHR